MIVTGDNTPAHVSDMGAWAPVIPVAVGPYETGGVILPRLGAVPRTPCDASEVDQTSAGATELVRDALREVLENSDAHLRLAFLSDCAGYEHWLKFELAYAAGRTAYFGPAPSAYWVSVERSLVDVSVHGTTPDGEAMTLCNVELKVLTNNKDFRERLRGRKNSVARDFEKLRARAQGSLGAGVVVVAISRKRYVDKEAWRSYSPISMESMKAELRDLASTEGATEFFVRQVIREPIERMRAHLVEHELEVLAYAL